MNVEQLKKSNSIIFECIAGSRAYHTHNEESDTDIRGIFVLPTDAFLSMKDPIKQVSDATNDTTFFELRRYFELAKNCNPNIIEMLYSPDDCINFASPQMKILLDNRDLFISQKAYHSFSGYAFAQIKRAKGQNKFVNNPKSEDPPDKMDFCWYIPATSSGIVRLEENLFNKELKNKLHTAPFRPILVKEAKIDLSRFNAAKMEHLENAYRIYDYADNAKGVFRGPNQQLAVESIPLDDEWKRFAGLIIYNEQAYKAAHKDWKNYWMWKKERNESRYRTQEAGEVDFDSKNLQHCVRLLWSGKNIIENGKPIVRFSGARLQKLRDIRNGKYSYNELMELVSEEMAMLDKIKKTSYLPKTCDFNKINKLYREIIGAV